VSVPLVEHSGEKVHCARVIYLPVTVRVRSTLSDRKRPGGRQGFAGVRLHGLRHSHASHVLAANVHPKIGRERPGHSGIAIIMNICSHLLVAVANRVGRR
jgi:integrase